MSGIPDQYDLPDRDRDGRQRQRQGQRFRIRCRHPVGTQPTGSGDPGRLGPRLSLSWGMPHVLPGFQAEASRGETGGVAARHHDLTPLPVQQRLQISVGPAPFPLPAADPSDVGSRDDHHLHLSPQPDRRGKGMIIARNHRPPIRRAGTACPRPIRTDNPKRPLADSGRLR